VHDVPFPAELSREEGLGLPGEQLIGEPLEGLAEQGEAAFGLVPGAEVEVAQPSLPATAAPFGGEYDTLQIN